MFFLRDPMTNISWSLHRNVSFLWKHRENDFYREAVKIDLLMVVRSLPRWARKKLNKTNKVVLCTKVSCGETQCRITSEFCNHVFSSVGSQHAFQTGQHMRLFPRKTVLYLTVVNLSVSSPWRIKHSNRKDLRPKVWKPHPHLCCHWKQKRTINEQA